MATNETPDDALDALLRREFEGHVPDDGFSERVARALPPRPRRHAWPLPLAAVCGGVLAWAAVSPSPLWGDVAREAAAGVPGAASAVLFTVALGLGALCGAWALEEHA